MGIIFNYAGTIWDGHKGQRKSNMKIVRPAPDCYMKLDLIKQSA